MTDTEGSNALTTPKHDTVRVYMRVTSIIWQRLSPNFGIRTINAIAKNAIARSRKAHPYLRHLKVTEDGLEWGEFETRLDEVDDEEVSTMLEDVMDEFFDAVATLIGRLVVGKMFAEAEEVVKKEAQR